MKSALFVLITMILTGCITAYERNEPGIYPAHLGFNGQDYLIGFKWAFDLPVERIGK